MEKMAANIITGCRIVCSIFMLAVPVSSLRFWGLYLLCGISDMVDGAVARKTGSVSRFGAGLDAAADTVFAAASLIRILPVLQVPNWVWIWMGVIVLIKISNLAVGLICRKRWFSLHTAMNKITGLLLFLLPLSLRFIPLRYSAAVVCLAATCAAVQEGYYTAKGREVL